MLIELFSHSTPILAVFFIITAIFFASQGVGKRKNTTLGMEDIDKEP